MKCTRRHYYSWSCLRLIIGIVWGITKIVSDVVGDYWKLFPLSLKYYPLTSSSDNVSNFGKMISNIRIIIRNYLYITTKVPSTMTLLLHCTCPNYLVHNDLFFYFHVMLFVSIFTRTILFYLLPSSWADHRHFSNCHFFSNQSIRTLSFVFHFLALYLPSSAVLSSHSSCP